MMKFVLIVLQRVENVDEYELLTLIFEIFLGLAMTWFLDGSSHESNWTVEGEVFYQP